MDAPDQKGRLDILKVHARNKKFDDELDLKEIALRTPGFSGECGGWRGSGVRAGGWRVFVGGFGRQTTGRQRAGRQKTGKLGGCCGRPADGGLLLPRPILGSRLTHSPFSPALPCPRLPGAGADLANLLNEAAILTGRRNKTGISQREIDDSIDRIVAGEPTSLALFWGLGEGWLLLWADPATVGRRLASPAFRLALLAPTEQGSPFPPARRHGGHPHDRRPQQDAGGVPRGGPRHVRHHDRGSRRGAEGDAHPPRPGQGPHLVHPRCAGVGWAGMGWAWAWACGVHVGLQRQQVASRQGMSCRLWLQYSAWQHPLGPPVSSPDLPFSSPDHLPCFCCPPSPVAAGEDASLISKSQIFARIIGALGGRAAEEVVFGDAEVTTGASSDLQQVRACACAAAARLPCPILLLLLAAGWLPTCALPPPPPCRQPICTHPSVPVSACCCLPSLRLQVSSMARAMVINYGFSEIGQFSLLDPSAQVRCWAGAGLGWGGACAFDLCWAGAAGRQ